MCGLRPTVPAMDPLDDLPDESRREVVDAVQATLRVETAAAEAIVRASLPLWAAMEEVGLVDGWGGREFVRVFPVMLGAMAEALQPPPLDEVLAFLQEREPPRQG